MNNKKYAIITDGCDVGFLVYIVNASDAKDALVKFCEWTGEFTEVRMEAINAVKFESAISLADEWLSDQIIQIHEIADIIYSFDGKPYIDII